MHPLASIKAAMEQAGGASMFVRLGAHGVEGYAAGGGLTRWTYVPAGMLNAGVSPLGAVVLGKATRARDLYRAAAEVLGCDRHWIDGFQAGLACTGMPWQATDATRLGFLSGQTLYLELTRRCSVCGSRYAITDGTCYSCEAAAEARDDAEVA